MPGLVAGLMAGLTAEQVAGRRQWISTGEKFREESSLFNRRHEYPHHHYIPLPTHMYIVYRLKRFYEKKQKHALDDSFLFQRQSPTPLPSLHSSFFDTMDISHPVQPNSNPSPDTHAPESPTRVNEIQFEPPLPPPMPTLEELEAQKAARNQSFETPIHSPFPSINVSGVMFSTTYSIGNR